MQPAYLVGALAGLVAAVMMISAAGGSLGMRLLLALLGPLPLFIAGLGWGTRAAGVAAGVSSIAVLAALGPTAGALQFVTQGLPAAVLCHLTLLFRDTGAQAATSPDTHPDQRAAATLEWYPIGRVVAAGTLISGFLGCITALLLGGGVERLREVMREVVVNVFLKELPGLKERQLTDAEISTLVEVAAAAMPAAAALTWLSSLLLNLYLAGRITRASGHLERPWPRLDGLELPQGFGIGLAGAFALAFVGGTPGLVGSAFAGAFFMAYVLVGLAIVHFGTRGQAARIPILLVVYLGLLILNTWAALALAVIGLVEPLTGWRRKMGQPPPD